MWAWMILARGLVAYLVWRFTVSLLGGQRIHRAGSLEPALLLSLAVFAGLAALGPSFSLAGVALLYALWLGLFLLERYLLLRSRPFRERVNRDPTVLIYRGKLLEHNLYRRRLTMDQLLSQLRSRAVFRLSDVELAILEPDGDLSVLRTPQSEPLTKQDMLVGGRHHGLAMELIHDGQIVYENLHRRNLSEKWLRDHLRAFGVAFVSEVALATVDENNELYVDKYDDQLLMQRALHPYQDEPSAGDPVDLKRQRLREKPISQPEQAYAEQQLRKALRDSRPEVPKKQ